jgi:aspartate/methionine/tyrosine aminotransferase
VIEQILKVKTQMDSGMFKPLQLAAVEALKQGQEWFAQLNEEYASRRVLAGEIFDILGVEYDSNSSGMFLWGRVPEGKGEALADKILYEAGVFITPGFIFGENGEDYIRISLCAKPELLKKAAERIRSVIPSEVEGSAR